MLIRHVKKAFGDLACTVLTRDAINTLGVPHEEEYSTGFHADRTDDRGRDHRHPGRRRDAGLPGLHGAREGVEVVLAASSGKTNISEAAANYGGMPTSASGAITSQNSTYVSAVDYTSTSTATGVITATATGDTNISGSTITLTGTYATSNGQVTWVCSGTIANKYLPSSCK